MGHLATSLRRNPLKQAAWPMGRPDKLFEAEP